MDDSFVYTRLEVKQHVVKATSSVDRDKDIAKTGSHNKHEVRASRKSVVPRKLRAILTGAWALEYRYKRPTHTDTGRDVHASSLMHKHLPRVSRGPRKRSHVHVARALLLAALALLVSG